jgi:hypothetical protein
MNTGEPDAGKLACPVREKADGKGLEPRAPRRRPISLDGGKLETESTITAPASYPTESIFSLIIGGAEHRRAGRGVDCSTAPWLAYRAPRGQPVSAVKGSACDGRCSTRGRQARKTRTARGSFQLPSTSVALEVAV